MTDAVPLLSLSASELVTPCTHRIMTRNENASALSTCSGLVGFGTLTEFLKEFPTSTKDLKEELLFMKNLEEEVKGPQNQTANSETRLPTLG